MTGPSISSPLGAEFDLMRANEARLLTSQSAGSGSQNQSKLETAAKEFESILLNQWLEQAREGLATVPGGKDEEDTEDGSEMISLGMQSLASALTKSGGLGIAKFICRELGGHEPASTLAGTASRL